jgi:hypothetical protein
MAERAHNYGELSQAAKRCRTFGHVWRPFDAEKRGRKGWWITLSCSECFCEKSFAMNLRGEVEQPSVRYRYPDHYLATFSVDDQGGRPRMRMEILTGVIGQAREARSAS